MKVLLKEAIGDFADEAAIGKVHLCGFHDTTACGLANEDYKQEATRKPLTCETCIDILAWAKRVAKAVKS